MYNKLKRKKNEPRPGKTKGDGTNALSRTRRRMGTKARKH